MYGTPVDEWKVMNKERPNEKDAKQIIEYVLGVELEHADKFGGVDYRSADGQLAIEVTRVTDGEKKSTREALRASDEIAPVDVQLQNCWFVFFPDTQSKIKTTLRDLPQLFAELESAGETAFDRQSAASQVLQQGPHEIVYRSLARAGVERACGDPHPSDPPHTHRVMRVLGSGGTSSGSDDALELLIRTLESKPDNFKKLAESEKVERHLFVWIDDDTCFDIARPLSRDAPSWSDGGFGLPSNAPGLCSVITHLWVVHEGARRGWLWDGESWHTLRDLPARVYE